MDYGNYGSSGQPFRGPLKLVLAIVNQVWDMERKVKHRPCQQTLQKCIDQMKRVLAEYGIEYEDPVGQAYDETRADCSASIDGRETSHLFVKETMKPIIRSREGNHVDLLQQAVVIVESGVAARRGGK